MKKLFSGKILLGIASLLTVLFLSSCLSTDDTVPTRLFVYVQLKGTTTQPGRLGRVADTTLVAGNDSLTISNVRFVTGKVQLVRDSVPLTIRPRMLRFSSTPSTNGQEGNVNSLVRAQSKALAGTYHAVDFKIVQAADSMRENGLSIDDIFYDGGHYSLIVKGTLNGSDFTFKSSHNFERVLPIQPAIDLPKTNAAANFIIYADVRDWFLDNSGLGFLDPSDNKNKSEININIAGSFRIRTQSTTSNRTM